MHSDVLDIRTATVQDLPDVLNVLDGAALQADVEELKRAIDEGDVLVAVAGSETERILGTLVLDGNEITSIAVRRRRRTQGIGTALVEAATERREQLLAEFDHRVLDFWESVGFTATPLEGSDRFRGRWPPES